MEPGTTTNNVAEQGLVPICLSIEIATKPWLFSAENMENWWLFMFRFVYLCKL